MTSVPSNRRRPQLAFIGAGVAGLAGSLAATQAGLRTRAFERADRSRDGGGPLWLPANAIRALKDLGAFAAIRDHTTELRRYTVLDTRRRTLFILPLKELQRKYGESLQVVQRRRLLEALRAPLPENAVHYQHPCVSARQWHAGVTPIFDPEVASSSPFRGHLFAGLIGADGFHSTIRRALVPPRALEPIGGWVWTGLARMPESDRRSAGDAELTVGFSQTFLSLPLRPSGAGEIGPPRTLAWWAASAHADPTSWQRLDQLGETVRSILDHSLEGSRMDFEIRDRALAERWSQGRITLLGDAAHPMTPALGQGASQALEGAVVLGQCLRRHPHDLPRAFRDYADRRHLRVTRIVRFARYLGAGLTLPSTSSSAAHRHLERTTISFRRARFYVALSGAEPMSSDPKGSRLPYFDMIGGHLETGHQEVQAALGHHVHFGFWETPPCLPLTAAEFRRAAERLSLGMARCAAVRDGASVLDVGCGFGGTLACLDRHFRNLQLTGLNLDERQLAYGRRNVLASTRNPVRLINGDASCLPFASRSFDAVLAVECILHFPSREAFFAEVRRVLRPGGRLVISDFIPSPLLVPSLRLAQFITNPGSSRHGPVDVTWTLGAYERLAHRHRLMPVQKHDITRQTLPSYGYLRRLLGTITRSPIEWWSLVTANSASEGMGRLGGLRYMVLTFAAC